MDAFDGNLADDLFPARLSVHVDSCGGAARDEFVAVANVYGRLHAGAGLHRFTADVSGRPAARLQLRTMTFFWQPIVVAILLLLALAYVSRRAWLRLASLKPSNPLKSSCNREACSGCGPTTQISTKQSEPVTQRPSC